MKRTLLLIIITTILSTQANASDKNYTCHGKSKAFTVKTSEEGDKVELSFKKIENNKWVEDNEFFASNATLLPNGGMIISSIRQWNDCYINSNGQTACLAIRRPKVTKIIHIWGRGATSIEGSLGYGVKPKNKDIRFKSTPEQDFYNCYAH